jgi:hypothetical protein
VPHYLKLDMAVTRNVDRDAYKQMIVKSMVALASNVGAVLIAEGVERWGELTTLRQYGVEWGQGFLFGRPAATPRARSECERAPAEQLTGVRSARRAVYPFQEVNPEDVWQRSKGVSVGVPAISRSRNRNHWVERNDGRFKDEEHRRLPLDRNRRA